MLFLGRRRRRRPGLQVLIESSLSWRRMPRLSGQRMRVQPSARRDDSDTSTHRAARATRLPSPATAGGGPAAIGATRSQRHEHAPCSSRDATALPSHGRWRAQTHACGGHNPTAGGGHKPMVQTQTLLIHKRSPKIQGLHVVKMFAQSLHCSLPEGM